jgi:hypothetical protein
MNIKTTLAGALALLIPLVPAVAAAQEAESPYGYDTQYAPPEVSVTALNIVPPAYGSVSVYEGRRLVGRFDGSGALWLPTGRVYRVVAMRGDQVLWNGTTTTTGVPIDLRWQAPQTWVPRTYYPRPRVLTPPVEQGRIRTPLP